MRDGDAIGAQEAQLRVRRVHRRIEEREPAVEHRAGRALGEVPSDQSTRVRAGQILLVVGAAVAVEVGLRSIVAGGEAGIEAELHLPGVGQAVAIAIEDTLRHGWRGQRGDEQTNDEP